MKTIFHKRAATSLMATLGFTLLLASPTFALRPVYPAYIVVAETTTSTPTVTTENCATNPSLPGCQELPTTGPLEIILATIIVLGIAAAGYYFYRTRKALRLAENTISGKEALSNLKDSSQNPDNMVQ